MEIFGSQKKLKCEYAAEISVSLADLIANSGNKVGFILFSDNIKDEMLPRKRKEAVDLFENSLSNASLYGGKGDYNNILDNLIKNIIRNS
jgi:uncharacterized protein (DUF58 family)